MHLVRRFLQVLDSTVREVRMRESLQHSSFFFFFFSSCCDSVDLNWIRCQFQFHTWFPPDWRVRVCFEPVYALASSISWLTLWIHNFYYKNITRRLIQDFQCSKYGKKSGKLLDLESCWVWNSGEHPYCTSWLVAAAVSWSVKLSQMETQEALTTCKSRLVTVLLTIASYFPTASGVTSERDKRKDVTACRRVRGQIWFADKQASALYF